MRFCLSVGTLCLLSGLLFISPNGVAGSPDISDPNHQEHFRQLLSPEETAWMNQGNPLRYAYDPDWAPFEWKNEQGIHTGIIADLFSLLRQRTNLKLEPVNTETWSESVELVRRGKADMFSAITVTEERKLYLDFTTRNIYTYPAVLVTHFEDRTVYLDLEKDATRKTIAIVEDSGLGQYVQQSHPTLNFLYVTSTEAGFNAVLNGRADLFAINTITAKYYIEQDHQYDIKIATKLNYFYQLKIAIHKDNAPVILPIIDKALSTITDSEQNTIFEKWTTVEKYAKTDWKLIAEISGIFLIIITFLTWHNVRLKKVVKKKTRKLRNLVNIDPLTGAYNRRKLIKDFSQEVRRAGRHNREMALVYIDLNNFKTVNDTHGHKFGDSVLKLVSSEIIASLRAEERFYRIGGDEFCILIPEVSDREELLAAKKRLKSFLLNIKTSDGQSIYMSYSAGIAVYPDAGDTLDALMAAADRKMYQDKKTCES